MRTASLLPVSPSMHCSQGCAYPGGCTLPGGVYLAGGVPAWVCTCPGGGGLPVHGGVPAQVLPLWTEFLTYAAENITLPQTSFAGGKNIDRLSFLSSICQAYPEWKDLS